MVDTIDACPPQPLVELLSRRWTLGARVAAICFAADDSAVAYLCCGGGCALAHTADPHSAHKRLNIAVDDGRLTLRPRRGAVPGVARLSVPLASRPGLAPWRAGELLAARPDGSIWRLGASATAATAAPWLDGAGPVQALASHPERAVVALARDDAIEFWHGPAPRLSARHRLGEAVAALAIAPNGAIGYATAAALGTLTGDGDHRRCEVGGGADRLCWCDGGRWLAGNRSAPGLTLWRPSDGATAVLERFAQRCEIACCPGANAVLASGAQRIAAWSLDTPPLSRVADGALRAGRIGPLPLSALAAHPREPLVAAGDGSGRLFIAQLGSVDELALFNGDGAAITALAWSADGRYLAAGDAGGRAALIDLPTALFKCG